VGEVGVVVGVEPHPKGAAAARALGHCHAVIEHDATDPLGTLAAVTPSLGGRTGFDLVVSCVNVENAEMTAILAARQRGRVYFFSMATSVSRAALGAEGVTRDVDMLIGNGYCEGHAAETLDLLRAEPALRDELARRFQ
jgi:L-erythro-3,5-diaminohexanoate dehydrogenase